MHRDVLIRNRPILLLLLPVAVAFWMVGWILYYKGSDGSRHRALSFTLRDNWMQVGIVLLKEETEVND